MVNLRNDPEYYEVQLEPIDDICPSPENDEIYGELLFDGPMRDLIDSIGRTGLEEPIIISEDWYIISGHRRYYACSHLGFDEIPVRIKWGVSREGHPGWHRLLAEYNPQRVKTAASLLREALMRDTSGDDVFAAAEASRRASATTSEVGFMVVKGEKDVKPITPWRLPFLAAAQKVIAALEEIWPLNIRQIHYNLLNDPPLKQTTKEPDERHRYRNDKPSYNALGRLLKDARYGGQVSWDVIDDETRPGKEYRGFQNVENFVRQETDRYLVGYHRDLQQGQPAHIEFLGEKNTIKNIIEPVCAEFHVPWTISRGYGNPSIWLNIAKRFRRSGKERMVLVIASDYDPEGFDLADDAIRSLRDRFDVPIKGLRCAVEEPDIRELGLASDPNPAKEDSTRLKKFIERTGGKDTWELEALPIEHLRQRLRECIESVLDTDIFNASVDQQKKDCGELYKLKQAIAADLEM